MVLTDFNVRIVDTKKGSKAITHVLIESSDGVETWGTVGASDNIIAASYEALRDAFAYKLLRDSERKSTEDPQVIVPDDEEI